MMKLWIGLVGSSLVCACASPEQPPRTAENVQGTTGEDDGSQDPPTTAEDQTPKNRKPAPWRGDADHLFRGTIGGAEVMFELRTKGDRVGGRYYYSKYKRSILLGGDVSSGQLQLTEFTGTETEVFGPASGRLRLDITGTELVGTWTSKDGKRTVKVELRPVNGASYDLLRKKEGELKWAEDRAFSYRPIQRFHEQLVYCSKNAQARVDVEMIPGLVDECFHVFDGKNGFRAVVEGQTFRVEELHDNLDPSLANKEFSTPIPEPGEGWGGDYKLEVEFARGRVLSYSFASSGLYVGAYPAHDQTVRTIDLRTGKHVRFEDMLEVANKASFMKELERVAPARSPEPSDGMDGCRWTDNWNASSDYLPLTAHISDKGLHITPQWAHVMKVCQYENIGRLVPRSFAQKYAKKGSLLDLTLKGNFGP